MTTTLDTIKSDLAALHARVAQFEAQRARTIIIPAMEIELREGEFYAGMALHENGTPSHHLILMDGDEEAGNWNDGMNWACKIGGRLPTRQEQALLYANCKKQFKEAWYWSGEQHADYSDYAWGQYFLNGSQLSLRKSASGRVRAVRSLPI